MLYVFSHKWQLVQTSLVLVLRYFTYFSLFLKLYIHIKVTLISHASKVILKILQARLQQYMNWELPDVKTGFRKGRGSWDQIVNIRWITEKARKFKNKNKQTCNSTSMTTLKTLTMWITVNCGKFLKKWEYQTTLPATWETCSLWSNS